MDLKSNFKKVLGVGLLGAAAITNTPAYAATGNVAVDIDLPTVLLMYYYSDITLDVDGSALGAYMITSAGSVDCGSDADAANYCNVDATAPTVTVGSVSANTVVPVPALTTPDFDNQAINFELTNAVAVRAIGCPTGFYQADYDVTGDVGVVAAETATTIEEIDGASCSTTVTPGNLDFDVDLSGLAPGATGVAATLAVTIVGI